jgi:tRNA-dihydrouridine synthase
VHELKLPVFIELHPTGVINEAVVYEMIGIQGLMRDPQELYDRLMARKKRVASDKIPVVIKSRAGVRWRYVVEAFNQAVRAKFKNIGFAN